ncbi:MAG: TonB-dependent receptor [Sphingomonadaceae bacterium]
MAALAVGMAAPSLAADTTTEASPIIVTAPRAAGSAIGDTPPQITLDADDIQALGASTLAEVIGLLSAQTRSGQGRGGDAPVVLLGGRRISGFAEVRDLPPEAIARIDVLPEEVALKYGYAATQRVINIVLVDRFKAITGELEPRFATGTKRNDFNTEFQLVRIEKGGRFTLDLQRQTAEALTEARRGVTDTGAGAPFRTLLPETEQFTANSVFARPLSSTVSATLSGRLDIADSRSLIGLLPGSLSPLSQSGRVITSRAGITLGGDVARWRWSFTGNYDRIEARTLTQTALPTNDRAESNATTAALDFTANGTLLTLPAGPVALGISGGAQGIRFNSETVRALRIQPGRVVRDSGTGRVNIDIPIASQRRGVLGFIGELSVNGNYLVQTLSDFGTLTTRGYGARWEPIKPLSFLVSVTDEDGAPTPQQLGNPVITTTGVQLFDFTRGESVIVTRLDGGNRALIADARHVVKAEATLKPLSKTDLTMTATYVQSQTRNPISGFPAITAAVEAALPGRVIREAGTIVSVDNRSVNFANADRSEIRWGFNYAKALGRDPNPGRPRIPGGFGGGRPGGGAGPAGGQGGGRFFGGGGGGNRLQISLYHTLHLTDRITIRDGLAPLDLLGGSAIGNRGGQPRHEVELSGGGAVNGIGVRFVGNWQSATRVASADGSPLRDLRFGSLATLNFRLFAFPPRQSKLAERWPLIKGVRLLFAVDNIFDARQRVTDGSGVIPTRYQAGLIDPLGRTIRVSIRKTFS